MSDMVMVEFVGGGFLLLIAILQIAGKRRQNRLEHKQDNKQNYDAIMATLRIKNEQENDGVERQHRKLNKLTAKKVHGELQNGKPVNGELGKQIDAVEDAEKEFYKIKEANDRKMLQLADDLISGKDIKKKDYI